MRSWSLVPEDWRRGIYVEQSFGMRVRYREKRRPALQRKPTSRRRVYWAIVASTISTWAIVSSHKMLRTSLFLSRLAFVAALVGCVQNGVRPLTTGSTAKEDSTVIVYGIKIEGDWRYPRFGIQLAEYSIEKQVMKRLLVLACPEGSAGRNCSSIRRHFQHRKAALFISATSSTLKIALLYCARIWTL